jgi:transcriptional regulator with XRE-family HTH domain
MPKRKTKLPPLKLVTSETFGQRLARFRKERGLTQVELAAQVGVIQSLVADYERDKLRLNAEMICRFTQALHVSSDVLLGLKRSGSDSSEDLGNGLSLKLVKRIQKIDQLPSPKQKVLLQTIDTFLQASGLNG